MISTVLAFCGLLLFHFYSTMRLHIMPFFGNKSGSTRVGILYGGRTLIHAGIWGMWLLGFFYLTVYLLLPDSPYKTGFYSSQIGFVVFDVIYSIIFVGLFLINGGLRVFFTSRNLGVVKRLLIVLFLWVPLINFYLAHIMCRAAKDEYQIALQRKELENLRVEGDECKTAYPLIMVHGIGFRDLRFFNYWGRIPLLLMKHGATVYYGHQMAWGTIEENAAKIAATIDQALSETGADKVNIIAHSKGGLDSRYLISTMGYGDKIASLTTMSTPHLGSPLIDVLNKLPDSVYHFIAGLLDKAFAVTGDEAPDCYSSSKQLEPAFCTAFNEANRDDERVFYQSYGSVMKSCFSDSLLSIPYFIMKLVSGPKNDGLVDEESAKWALYCGTLANRYRRGISHGDMIDLKREDIKGFDVLQIYYNIVVELKGKGF